MNKDFKISVVIPTFNEVSNIGMLVLKALPILENYAEYEMIFIDDGSTDGSLAVLKRLHELNENIKYVSFSRNFGHQMALRAGIDYATGDCIITMDADLQHPPEMIPGFVEKWMEGYEIVYTVREESDDETYFKKISSSFFYQVIKFVTDIPIEKGAADFRLIDRKVADYIIQLKEKDLFLRGVIPWLGFKQYRIDYTPAVRYSGKTKYSLKKMLTLAATGITSFSTKPLYMSAFLGFLMVGISVFYGLYALFQHLFNHNVITGWASIIIFTSLIGGIQLMMIGVIGIYLGKTFQEMKGRPCYVIQDFAGFVIGKQFFSNSPKYHYRNKGFNGIKFGHV